MSDPLFTSLQSSLGPSQSNRLLTLHTPLGADVLLAERMVCEESVGPGNFFHLEEVLEIDATGVGDPNARKAALQDLTGYRVQMTALSTNPDLVLEDLRAKPVRLDWLTDAQPACVHGVVTRFELLGSDGGLARYGLRIEPGLRLLAHRVDAWVFQSQSVVQIIDEVLGEHAQQRGLKWRWDLADESVYPVRSLCVQYEESDLAFLSRLMAEEGLYYWFEHSAEGGDLGTHTLVISDHVNGLPAHAQGSIRFAQSASAAFKQDTLNSFEEVWRLVPTKLVYGSWDYRKAQLVHAQAQTALSQRMEMVCMDPPGAYAFENGDQAQRLALRHLEALQMPARLGRAGGNWRAARLAQRWKLSDHPSVSEQTEQVALALRRRARNNISAEQHTALIQRLGELPAVFDEASGPQTEATKTAGPRSALANHEATPLYEVELMVQEASLPVRAPWRGRGADALFDRPVIKGVQSAVVVGGGQAVYTDRDNRVRIQFHWQRGDKSSHRLTHNTGSNAPGTQGAGTWVRVAQATASVNSGEVFVPRTGQEVLVSFLEGDVDRPVVVGSAYGGRGQPNGQGNQVAPGPSTLTGNAGPWFGGSEAGHAHGAVLSGFKTQSLSDSATGMGGYNQLVLDDTPGQSRVMLGTTSGAQGVSSWLSLGHLLHQVDNQRLEDKGHGLELVSNAQGAIRAGAGLHITAHAQPQGTQGAAHSMASREVVEVLAQGQQFMQALSETAQQHQAGLPAVNVQTNRVGEGAEPKVKELPVIKAQEELIESLKATEASGRSGQDGSGTSEGSAGTPAWAKPELVLSAPGGVVLGTPGHAVYASGQSAAMVGQDVNFGAQHVFAMAVTSGVTWFTEGRTAPADKPNQEGGLQLHAAKGKVSVQSKADQASLKAKGKVTVCSTSESVECSAPKHVLLTAGGSALRIEPGKITMTTMRQAVFKAQQRVFTGPAAATGDVTLNQGSLEACPSFQAMVAGAGGSVL